MKGQHRFSCRGSNGRTDIQHLSPRFRSKAGSCCLTTVATGNDSVVAVTQIWHGRTTLLRLLQCCRSDDLDYPVTWLNSRRILQVIQCIRHRGFEGHVIAVSMIKVDTPCDQRIGRIPASSNCSRQRNSRALFLRRLTGGMPNGCNCLIWFANTGFALFPSPSSDTAVGEGRYGVTPRFTRYFLDFSRNRIVCWKPAYSFQRFLFLSPQPDQCWRKSNK